MSELKFSLFADLHYAEGMYMSTVADVERILERAAESKVDFVIHAGDFCNDYSRSPEIVKAYLNNPKKLPVYGVYGNHELEAADNSMQVVTPLLSNRTDELVWGTEDGKLGNGSIAYYYFDVKGFRIICSDTNHSYNPRNKCWEHNKTASCGHPEGNEFYNCLAPRQLQWLEETLMSAAKAGLRCLVFSHTGFTKQWGCSSDTDKVREIYSRVNAFKSGTILMSVNGHLHTNHFSVEDNILFWDVNTVRNGWWQGKMVEHYGPEHTFDEISYSNDGEALCTKPAELGKLIMGRNTWFFTEPLNAIVTVSDNGEIKIDGMEADWIYGIAPETDGRTGVIPEITSCGFKL